ncbi:MAG: hypothetical protein LUH02_03285 [Erysipelotrichaceae bacterium]|nr:hypothetical protein [Erysipelotrichaceae bacterium]
MKYEYDINDNETLLEIINKTDETLVKQYLNNILMNDQLQALDFKLTTNKAISSSDMKRYIFCVEEIFNQYKGKNNRILSKNYSALLLHLLSFLMNYGYAMFDKQYYKEAFILSSYIFSKINPSDIYDEKGTRDHLNSECISLWDKILDKCDKQTIEHIYHWLKDYLDRSLRNYYIDIFFLNHFKDKNYLEDKLIYLSEHLYQENYERYKDEFRIQRWGNMCIIVLKQLGYSYEQIHEYLKDYWHYPFIRQQYITYCIDHQLYDEAILILEESLQLDTKKEDIIQYRQQLKDIYLNLDDNEAYKKQLWYSITVDDPGNLDDYLKLKSLYTDNEWKDIREDIFLILPDDYPFDILYKEEKLYDRLLEFVINKHNFTYLYKYDDILKDKYPKQILQAYQTILNERVKNTAYRETYRSWVTNLIRMREIDGGEKIVDEIVQEWKIKYHNRKALMEELERL